MTNAKEPEKPQLEKELPLSVPSVVEPGKSLLDLMMSGGLTSMPRHHAQRIVRAIEAEFKDERSKIEQKLQKEAQYRDRTNRKQRRSKGKRK